MNIIKEFKIENRNVEESSKLFYMWKKLRR